MVNVKVFGLQTQSCNIRIRILIMLKQSKVKVLESHIYNGVVLHPHHSLKNCNTYIEEGSVDVISTVIITLGHQKWSRSIGWEYNAKYVSVKNVQFRYF